jgi:hypothetical protein
MDLSPRSPEERYGPALVKAQEDMKTRSPYMMAEWAGVPYTGSEDAGEFTVRFWDATYTIQFPSARVFDAAGAEPYIGTKIILLHYLLTAKGTPLADQWVAFRDFPGGLGYNAAFEARANRRLAATFGERLPAFEAAARGLGGMPLDVGDAAFTFDLLPRVRVAVVIYAGDEEFPAAANLIFDAATGDYLPTEDIAVLGDIVASKLGKYNAG